MPNEIQFLLYNTSGDEGQVQVVVKDETLWCTQKAMAQLFGVGVSAISKHLKNIFAEGELQKEVVVSKMEIATRHGAIEGKTQTSSVEFYHHDAIIATGYRVNSARATRFRQWATAEATTRLDSTRKHGGGEKGVGGAFVEAFPRRYKGIPSPLPPTGADCVYK